MAIGMISAFLRASFLLSGAALLQFRFFLSTIECAPVSVVFEAKYCEYIHGMSDEDFLGYGGLRLMRGGVCWM